MSKIGVYRPEDKYKNYSLSTSKPLKSHAYFTEKVWTMQEQIYKKLKNVAKYLESLYPKLTDDFGKNIKVMIEKNLGILIKDLDLMQQSLHKNPDSFNTKKLKINQHHIDEMRNVCDALQTVNTYEYEFKNLGKTKHALNELEHLIQPTKFEKSLEKAQVKSGQKTKSAKKLPKQKKTAKPARKLKSSGKKVAKPKRKLPAKSVLKAKPASKKKR